MNLLDITTLLTVTFLLVIVMEHITKSTLIPLNVYLVLAGFVGSEVALLFVDDLGIRWYHIRDIILYLLIPIILFQTIFKLDFRLNRKDFWITLILALPLGLITAGSLSVLLYWLIGDPEKFPPHSAILAGVLLSSTSPAMMGMLLKAAKAPERLAEIMMGESLFNGLITIMLFFFLLPLSDASMTSWSTLGNLGSTFLYHTALGAIVGGGIAWLLVQLMYITESGYRHLIITQAGCFVSYYIAGTVLQISGVAMLLPTALVFLYYMQKPGCIIHCQFTQTVWEYKRYLAGSSLHILMGISLTVGFFTEQWLAMIIGIVSTLFIRAIVVFFILPPTRKTQSSGPLNKNYRSVLWLGGMRGGSTIALALSIPETVTGWWIIQAIAYGAVLFSLSFQASLLPVVVARANRLSSQKLSD